MTPFKIFWKLTEWLGAAEAIGETSVPDDPFHHPDVFRMDLRQLADLPFRSLRDGEQAAEQPDPAKCA